MEYINFGGDYGKIPVKFSVGAQEEIEREGNRLPAELRPATFGKSGKAPLICVDFVNNLRQIPILVLVVEAITRGGRPDITTNEVRLMIDSYIEKTADLPELINEIIPMYDRGLAPRGMAARAKAAEEKDPPDSGKKSKK